MGWEILEGKRADGIRLRLKFLEENLVGKRWELKLELGRIQPLLRFKQKNGSNGMECGEQVAKLRGEINNFYQLEGESLYDAWERFKYLLRKCPHHGIEKWMLVHNFYNGLCGTTRTIIDAATGGAFMSKSANEAYELLEEMAMNNYQWPSERGNPRRVARMHEIDAISMLSAQVATLTKQLQNNIVTAPVMQAQVMCKLCGGPHSFEQFQFGDVNNLPLEQAQAIGNFPRQPNNLYSNFYNQGWRNQPNFSWKNDQQPQSSVQQPQQSFQQRPLGFYQQIFRPQQQPPQPPMQQQQNHVRQPDTQSDVLNQLMTKTRSSNRNLETQMGKLATLMANRGQGNLPSTTEFNPKEHCKAITLRSGKKYEGPSTKQSIEDKDQDNQAQWNRSKVKTRLCKNNLDKQFSKFLEVFKKLHINIPFAEALEQMPSYVKFMKDILSKKRKMGEYETVALTEECGAILQRKLP
ncbi:uncharacterized protein LOC133779295 [Humulus lupulus]|uniref:uncharacterized protein LOC133779295 n=1 Tax=Humulus lupulus TaxID=3486 RepID=UPI002B416F9D|nr:uncharacterized protein LOC133779295 [Humulus lupulus]